MEPDDRASDGSDNAVDPESTTSGGDYPRPRDAVLDSSVGPDDGGIVIDPQQHESPFKRLFGAPTKVAILDVLLSAPNRELTASEIVDQRDDLSRSSFDRQREDLLEFGVLVETGKTANARTYALNTDHPTTQVLQMLQNVILTGWTPMVLDEDRIRSLEDLPRDPRRPD